MPTVVGMSTVAPPSEIADEALAILRELTGRDAAPTAEAWRRLLGRPAPKVKMRVALAR